MKVPGEFGWRCPVAGGDLVALAAGNMGNSIDSVYRQQKPALQREPDRISIVGSALLAFRPNEKESQ